MSNIKKFNEDWEGDNEEVDVPGYGKWPNGDDGGETSSETPSPKTWNGILNDLYSELNVLYTLFDEGYLNDDGTGLSDRTDIEAVNDEIVEDTGEENKFSSEEEFNNWLGSVADLAIEFGSFHK